MKILFIHDYAAPTGGAEIETLNMRDALRQRGHDTRLFASSAGSTEALSQADYLCFGTTSRFRTLLQSANPWAFVRLRRVLKEFRPDIVHVCMFLTQLSPLILPLLRDTPSMYHILWYRPICPTGTKWLPEGTLCSYPVGRACHRNGCLPLQDWVPLMGQMALWKRWRSCFNRFVTNSYAMKARLEAGGIAPVEAIWNGVPASPVCISFSNEPTLAFAGRLTREKGVVTLLQAFHLLRRDVPSARLLIAGDGPERARLSALAAHYGLEGHVTFLGHVPHSELDYRLADAWIQVIPSLWEEPFGLVAPEAMMRGAAVVASAVGGLQEIVQDGKTGFLVPPGDADALAKRLLELTTDRALAQRMGQAGYEVAMREFHNTTFIDRMIQVYHTLIAGLTSSSHPS